MFEICQKWANYKIKDILAPLLVENISKSYDSCCDCEKQTNESQSEGNKVDQNKDIGYPVAVIFVLCSKFFESFSANSIRSKYIILSQISINKIYCLF